MKSRSFAFVLALCLTAPTVLFAPCTTRAVFAQGGAARIVGPRGETTPVVNENNELQLKVEGAGPVSRWTSDSPEIATVSNAGVLSGKNYGFATITAETGAVPPPKVIVVVARKTPRRASRAQGDTKTDTGGNVYLSSPTRHVVYRSDGLTAGVIAGKEGEEGYEPGAGGAARFNGPTGLSVNQSARGGVYVADTANHCIRRIHRDGSVGLTAGLPQHEGRMVADRAPISEVVLSRPRGVVVVGGNLIVADTENHCLWYLDLERDEVRLVAGEPGVAGPATANGRGRAARFNRPTGLAVSTDGRLVAVADTGNNVIRLIGVGVEAGVTVYDVTTLGLGSSRRGAEISRASREDRGDDAIDFEAPESVSIDGVGNVYVVDTTGAVVVTRREDAVEVVELAQFGTLGSPASVTLSGTQAFVLNATATTDESVNVVEVGAPEITSVTPGVTGLAGGERVVIDGSNFAPESLVTLGDRVVTSYEVISARRIEMDVPAGISAPGVRTVTVATRGGLAQHKLEVRARPLADLDPGEITTVAGGVPYIGDGGAAVSASIGFPTGIAVDAAGNLYVADPFNNRVRRVDPVGRITTVAGTGEAGYDGDNKPATSARLHDPQGVAVDASGNLYIAEGYGNRVRQVDINGQISTVAGTGEFATSGDGGPAISASIAYPTSVAVDGSGNLYIAENESCRIRRVNRRGRITTIAGSGFAGYDGDDKQATSARLNYPNSVAVDAVGNLYIADTHNYRVRRVDASGRIKTVAGNGKSGYNGDGKRATRARISCMGVAIDPTGNLYIADTDNNRVRCVDTSGRITTVAGTGEPDYDGDDKPAITARLNYPTCVAVDAAGNLYIGDSRNGRARKVDTAGQITTRAGTGEFGFGGDGDPAVATRLNAPRSVALDLAGNLFIADTENNRIRRVDTEGRTSTVAGTGKLGYDGDDKPATEASLGYPYGVAVDAAGNLYIADTANNRVRRVDVFGRITTVAGAGNAGYTGDGGPATLAQLNYPTGIAVDASGNLFIADAENSCIRRVEPNGRITTVAGTGEWGYNGDEIPATEAQLGIPYSVAVDAAGNLYIADTFNFSIRRVDTTGRITTVAGSQSSDSEADDQPATSAFLDRPTGIAVAASGDLYISDSGNARVRRVDTSGWIRAVAGTGEEGYNGDNGPASLARLGFPAALVVDAHGDVYFADTESHAVRAIRRPASVTIGSVQVASSTDPSRATQRAGLSVHWLPRLRIRGRWDRRGPWSTRPHAR